MEAILTILTNVGLLLAVLFVLILAHEWGHFIVAKRTGMRVDEFGIGFPPRLFKRRFGETLYTLNALPIGGFVRIWGENYEQEFSREGEQNSQSEFHKDTNPNRAFSARPKWAQALVLVAGVTMNVLLAWFLFSLAFIIGVPTAVEEDVASEAAQLYITQTFEGSPAEVIPAGAIINSARSEAGEVIAPVPSELITLVAETGPNEVLVTYTFGDETAEASLLPAQGIVEAFPERYAIGASLVLVENQSQPVHTAFKNGFISTYEGLIAISVGLTSLVMDAFGGGADFSQIAGPVGIAGLVGDAAATGFVVLLMFTAVISLNLAIINMLPFPALDGGRLLFVAIEAVTRRPIPAHWAGRLNLFGFVLLMILMIAVTYNDIIRLI